MPKRAAFLRLLAAGLLASAAGLAPRTLAAEQPAFDLEAATRGTGFLQGLVPWRWRPGQGDLVAWRKKPTPTGPKQNHLIALDPETGARRSLLVREDFEAAVGRKVPQAGRGRVERIGRAGVAPYWFSADGRRVLLQVRGDLAYADLASGARRRLTEHAETIRDVKWSPNGRSVSYSKGYDLWVVEASGGTPRALTSGGTPELRNARLDWLIPEELGLTTAHWWSPDSSKIAFIQVDETNVDRHTVAPGPKPGARPRTMYYPRPGTPNPLVRIAIVKPDAQPSERLVWARLGTTPPEYIARVAWASTSEHLFALSLDRRQRHLQLWVIHAASGEATSAWSKQIAQGWIDPPPAPYTLPDGSFLLRVPEAKGPSWQRFRLQTDGTIQRVEIVTKPTTGTRARPYLDPNTGHCIATFEGRHGPVVHKRASRQAPWQPAPFVPQRPLVASATWNDGATHALVSVSSPLRPRERSVHRLRDGAATVPLGREALPTLEQLSLATFEDGEIPLETPALKRPDGSPCALRWRLWRPAHPSTAHAYPLIVHTYGGPGTSMIRHTWSRVALFSTYLCRRGFYVLHVDGRGSRGQGPAFQHAIEGRLGRYEIEDHARVVQHLAERPDIDGSRVGIYGWSFGGTMVLNGLAHHGDAFHAGFAVAPVSDWLLYDTIYTERFLGMPTDNPLGYRATAPLRFAKQMRGDLYIVHGLSDDNVHPINTLRLVDALLAEKHDRFDTMLLPGRGHGLGNARGDMLRRMIAFFERTLRGTAVPR